MNRKTPRKIQIIGAGAIGCLTASRLARSGLVEVALVARPRFIEAFKALGGIRVHEEGRAFIAANIETLPEPTPEADLYLFAVKSYDTKQAADELYSVGGPEATVVSLQNGVGNELTLCETGFTRVGAASLTTPVSVLGRADIRIDRPSAALGLAAWRHGNFAPIDISPIAEVFGRSGFDTSTYSSAAGLKWTKLLMNMAANATSAILDKTASEVFTDPRLVDLEIDAWREALAVMGAAGIEPVSFGSYPFGVLAPLIRGLPKLVLRPVLRRRVAAGRGAKMPSLHIDVHGGSGRTEIPWLNGAVVERGTALGVTTPVNRVLTEAVESLASSPSAWDATQLLAAVDSERQPGV